MSVALSPIVSEFETEEQAASYDRWFRAKVQASLADTSPRIPHDEVMAHMNAIIEEAEIITYIAERSPQAARNIRRHIAATESSDNHRPGCR